MKYASKGKLYRICPRCRSIYGREAESCPACMERGVISSQPRGLVAICLECGVAFGYPATLVKPPKYCPPHRQMVNRPSDPYKNIRRCLDANNGELVFDFPPDIRERVRRGEL